MFVVAVIVCGEAAVVLNIAQYLIEAVMVAHSGGEVHSALSKALACTVIEVSYTGGFALHHSTSNMVTYSVGRPKTVKTHVNDFNYLQEKGCVNTSFTTLRFPQVFAHAPPFSGA